MQVACQLLMGAHHPRDIWVGSLVPGRLMGSGEVVLPATPKAKSKRRGRQPKRPPRHEHSYCTASTEYRRMVLTALSRCGARSVHSFDFQKASAFSRLSHSVIATRWGGGGPSRPTTFPPPVRKLRPPAFVCASEIRLPKSATALASTVWSSVTV